MNVHQMIEHVAYAFRQASGLVPLPPAHDEALMAKMYSFLMSDKPFRDNTPNQFLPDTPPPPNQASIDASLHELEGAIHGFFAFFDYDESKTVLNPFFGTLHFMEWVQLLYKHTRHHLRQFGVLI
jgi:hypothetical protein